MDEHSSLNLACKVDLEILSPCEMAIKVSSSDEIALAHFIYF